MICHEHRCVFIHQRKNAGTSIIQSFGFKPMSPEWRLFNNGTLSEEWQRRDESAKDYLVFTVVRNPWDRFVSGWKYLPKYRDLPLDEVMADLPQEGHDYRHPTRPQLDILVDAEGRFVPDFVIRYENLEADYRALCRLIGKCPRRGGLRKTNTARHAGLAEYRIQAQVDFVAEHFKMDIEFFSYSFDRKSIQRP